MLSGNTQQSTLTGRVDLLHELTQWRHSMLLESRLIKQNKVTIDEHYRVATQLDYKISPLNYTFTLLNFEDDRFSGYDYRASIAAGYGRRLWRNGEDYLDLLIGPGYR